MFSIAIEVVKGFFTSLFSSSSSSSSGGSNAKSIIVILLMALFLSIIAGYIFYLQNARDTALQNAAIYQSAYEKNNEAITLLKEHKKLIDKVALEVQAVRESFKEELKNQKFTLDTLIQSNNQIKEWANAKVPKDIQNLLISP